MNTQRPSQVEPPARPPFVHQHVLITAEQQYTSHSTGRCRQAARSGAQAAAGRREAAAAANTGEHR